MSNEGFGEFSEREPTKEAETISSSEDMANFLLSNSFFSVSDKEEITFFNARAFSLMSTAYCWVSLQYYYKFCAAHSSYEYHMEMCFWAHRLLDSNYKRYL